MQDEELVHQTRFHPIILLWSLIFFVLSGGILKAFWDDPYIRVVALLIFGVCLLRFAQRGIYYLTSEYGVTTKRVLGKTGFIWRESLDIVLAKVEAVRLYQTILGRLLNYGSIEVTGTGGTEEILRYIPNPLQFRNCIQEQVWNSTEGDDHEGHLAN